MDEFLIIALLAGFGLALVAGPLGCIVVWRRMAYFGDTLAHSALLGVALAIAAQLLPIIGVVITGVVLAAALYWLEQHRELSMDTLLGILSHTALALGLIVLSLLQTRGASVDLMGFLFGDILAVSVTELVWIYTGAIIVSFLFLRYWRSLLSISVHEDMAMTDGINVSAIRFMFILMLAVVIAMAIKVVGVLLITALLIIPAASARLFARSPVQMIMNAIVFALLAVALGFAVSLQWDIPTGPAIVLASAAGFIAARVLRLQHAF